MKHWIALSIALALIAGCSEPVDTSFKHELDKAAQERGIPPLPMLKSDPSRVYRGARLADPFYPSDSKR